MENFIHFRKFSLEYWNLVQTCGSTKLDRILLEQQVVLISNSIFKSVDNIIHYVQYSTICLIYILFYIEHRIKNAGTQQKLVQKTYNLHKIIL